MDRIHARLKAAIEVKETVRFWGATTTFVPRLCSKVFGDGRALLQMWALNTRPCFYVIRIDSSWNVEDYAAPDDAPDLRDHLDDIYGALEDDFGSARWADDEDVQEDLGEQADELREWPAFDDTLWYRMDWPAWRDVLFTDHQYSRYNIIVAASSRRTAQREAKRQRSRQRKRRGW